MKNSQKLLTVLLMTLVLSVSGNALSTDKTVYEPMEEVVISLTEEEVISSWEITISSADNNYRLIERLERENIFKPTKTGSYEVKLVSELSEKSINFEVVEPETSQDLGLLKIDKTVYSLGEEVIITSQSSEGELVIKAPNSEYRLSYSSNEPVEFVPRRVGNYFVELKTVEGQSTEKFEVIEKQIVTEEIPELDAPQIVDETKELVIGFDKKEFKSVKLNGAVQARKNIKIEKVDSEKEIFEIDPNLVEFSTAEITKVAKGVELQKCSSWNSETNECEGYWNKVKDIIPGKEYTIIVENEISAYLEVIRITNATHLDSNKNFVSDIYAFVKELDGNWSETIFDGEFVRVVFEAELSSTRDITIYPRTISGTPRIEVYELDGTELIAEFAAISDNEFNKVYLTNLLGSQDTFDLKIMGGSVEFDLIIDPILFSQVCNGQDNNAQNTFNDACDGSYPAACGAGNDLLTCNDGQFESHWATTNNQWAGVRMSSYDSSMNCESVTAVQLCYEWWRENGFDNFAVRVDNDNWGSPTTVDSSDPGTSANPGVTCIDVTSNDDWVCGNFDGSGTAAQAATQAQSAVNPTRDVNTDVLYFNVTYTEPNNPPTQGTPTLTSESGGNSTSEDLTCNNQSTADADGDSVRNIYSWYKDSNPYYLINTPFEGGSTSTLTRDYSGNENNGTVADATWNESSGFDGGGAYYFDGDNDWITYGDIAELDQADYFTVAMWFNRDVDNAGTSVDTNHLINNVLMAQSSNGANDNFELGTEGTNVELYLDASADHLLTYDAGIQDDTWYHIAVTFDSTDTTGEARLYIDGVEVTSWNNPTADLDNSAASPLTIGIARIDANWWGDFEGYIDEVLVTNTSLTAEQILAIYQNKTNTIVSEETAVDDVWMCQVTPNDREDDGSTASSASMTILNPPPLVQQTQCQVASSWQDCDTITYAEQIESVRTNCTSQAGGSIDNVTFTLTNAEDSKTYFSNTVTSQTGAYWEYDFTDFTIYDSGTFTLNTTCRENPTTEELTSWGIAFGSLSVTLVDPNSDENKSQNEFFTFEANVTCTGGECGYVNVTLDPIAWDDTNFNHRMLINLTEPQSLARTHDHILVNITIPSEQLSISNENGTVMYCDGVQTQWDAYAIQTSGGWITHLEGVGAVNLTADENLECFVYFDPSYSGTELALTTTGWAYVSDGDTAGTTAWKDLTPAGVDCEGTDDDGEWEGIYPCTGADSTTYGVNEWCLFEGQTEGSQNFWRNSDDCSVLYVNGTNVAEGCYNQPDSGSYTTELGRYYPLTVYWAENTGGNYVRMALGSSDTGQELDTECHPMFGDEWELTMVYGSIETNNKGIIPMNSGTPFYTTTQNPANHTTFSCLENMTAGDSCSVSWSVNATGEINSTWEFFVSSSSMNYSTNISEAESSHINITILDSVPPTIGTPECIETGGSWGACSGVQFGDTLDAVRVTCTPGDDPIDNVTFSLENVEDSKIFFTNTTTDNSTGYWMANVTNLYINDSGTFNLNASCAAGSSSSKNPVSWQIAWGTLTATLIDPSTDSNVTQNVFFDFTSRISCTGGECGDIKASLDPIGFENSGGVTGTSFSLDIGTAGTDRLVAIFADDESSGTSLTGVTVDSNACTLVTVSENTVTGANHQELWYCDEDDLGSSAGSVTIAVTGGDAGWGVHAQVFTNVSQNGWYNYTIDDTSNGQEEILPAAVNIPENGLLIFGAGDGNGGTYNDADWDTNPTQGSDDGLSPEIEMSEATDGPAPSSATLATAYWISSTTEQSSRLFRARGSNANNRGTGIIASWEEATIGGTKGLIPMNSGTPFYTTTQNPANRTTFSCLGNMVAGESCDTTWSVNATGALNSTWEFFVIYETLNYSANVSDKNTSKINITIIDNQIPTVSGVSITPTQPSYASDLSCVFTVNDANPGENLSATIYWYESGVLSYTSYETVNDGVESTSTLDSGNTTADEVWHCGVVPYDEKSYGTQVNSSNVTILSTLPPVISNIQCQEYGLLWSSCSNLAYGDLFTAVRATCTDADGYVSDVNFSFSNQEDSYTYFDSNYTSNVSSVYTYDNSNIDIADSGNFNITVSCTDNASVTATSTVSWAIPWGTLAATLISPNSNINVTQNGFFNFTSQIACSGGECGYLNATLDPTPSWWNGLYRYRKQINVTNNEGSTLQTGYSMNITVNTTGSKFQNDGDDLRVLWNNGGTWVELDRINETSSFNNESTEIWFKLQAAINSGATDSDYWIYYGSTQVSNPPVNRSNIYLYFDDFNRDNVADITTESAYGQTGGGTWSINGNKLVNVGASGDPNKLEIDALGDVNYDVDMLTKINVYSTLGSSSDLWRIGLSSNIDDSGGDGRGYCLLFHQDHSSLDMLNDLRSWGTLGSYSWGVDTWYYMRFQVIDPSANSGQGKVWELTDPEPAAWSIDGNFGGGAVRGYGELGFGGSRQGDTTYFDDILIKYVVDSKPSYVAGPEEEYGLVKGIIPMTSGDPFYTTTQNPMNHTTAACLASMIDGDYCNSTWLVNATGTVNTTWEFFTLYDSLNYSGVSQEISSTINITIIENIAPVVSNVTLTPTTPVYSDDLVCDYLVTDPSQLDELSVNVTWYLNGTHNQSVIQNVVNGVSNNLTLGFGNTSTGQVWHCGVTPSDQFISGTQVNSSNVTILFNKPPDINTIECTEDNIAWVACSTLDFNDVLMGVRANCTSEAGTILNVTYNLTNVPDSYTYYNSLTSSNISDYWPYLENVTLNDSGQYSLGVTCRDNNSDSTYDTELWSLPWGTLGIDLVDPAVDGYVERNQYFDFIVNVTCTGGECGRAEITLDPISGTSPATGVPDSGFVYDNPGNDEEGGDYTNTQTYDGPQGGAGSNFYYIVGEGTTANTALSYINLVYNISPLDIDPKDIEELKFNIIYCHSGENDVNQDFCNDNVPMEKSADGAQNVEVYDFVSDSWVDIGDITVNADEDMYNESYIATGTLSNYVNSTNEILVRYEADFSDTGGDGFLAIDYAPLTVNYTKLKRGAVSTIVGDTPFYTTDPNPLNYTTDSCLSQLIAGNVPCQIQWQVNATGVVGSTHDFFIIYNMTTNQAYVNDGDSSHIDLTIQDSSAIPPIVTLEAPGINAITNNATTIFYCSATDAIGLQNMSLHANFSGSFIFNESKSLSGTSDSENFTKTLSEGYYLWNCIAYDTDDNYDWGNSNRTLTVDLTPPNITISYPDNGDSFTDSDIDFNFTTYDNMDSSILCNLTVDGFVEDSTTATSGVLDTMTAALGQGIHWWNVTCIDDAGNTNTSETRNFTISDIGPTVNLITADNLVQSATSIDLEYLPSDNNGITIARLLLNGVENDTDVVVENAVINEFSLMSLAEGIYTWTVNVSDVSNLTAQASARTFTIDYTPPNINLSLPYDTQYTNLSSLEFNFTPIDNYDLSLTCNITFDGSVVHTNFAAGNNSLTGRTISGITDGLHYWNVTCIDDAGNTNTSETRMLNATSPPTVSLEAPEDNHTYNDGETIELNYTATDNGNFSSCILFINGVQNQTNSTTINNGGINSFELADVLEGEYNWTVMCTDLVGLNTTAAPNRTFYVDLTDPTLTVYEPDNGDIYSGNDVFFNFTATDNMDSNLSCDLVLDGTLNETGINGPSGIVSNFTVTVGLEGTHWWNMTCYDNGGRYNTSETRNFTVLTPPEVTLFDPDDNAILNYSQDVEFRYQPIDGQALNKTELIINGTINATNNTPQNGAFNSFFFNFSEDGVYVWTVNATDDLGLIGTATPRTLTIDTTPPNITILAPTDAQVMTYNNVSFNFTVEDNLDANLECEVLVDGISNWNETIASGGTFSEYKLLYDGTYNWTVSCIDHANHTTIINTDFSVDAPPSVILNDPFNGYRTTSSFVEFNYTPIDDIGFENCSLFVNGAWNKSNTNINPKQINEFNVSDLPDGDHNWTVQCFDETPDFNEFTAVPYNFTIDNVGPSITLIYPGEGSAVNENNITFNWTASDYDGVTISCDLTVDGVLNTTGINETSGSYFTQLVNGLSDGDHNWTVSCIDDLGNSNTSVLGNFTINQPDLVLEDTGISFSNTNPDLYENITITANVSNIGGNPASDVLVSFYDGVPGAGGINIGNDTITSVGINSSALASITWLITPNYHNIWVLVDPEDTVGELNESNNNGTSTISVLWANITLPANNTLFASSPQTLNYTLYDYTGGLINYTIFRNAAAQNSGQSTDSVSDTDTFTMVEGANLVYVRATDYLLRVKDSPIMTYYLDLSAPVVVFNTQDDYWFNQSLFNISFNISDNIDTNIYYDIYINTIYNRTDNASSGSTVIENFNLPDGNYNITVEPIDDVNNTANYTITIHVDTQGPNVSLETPTSGTALFSTSTNLNYSVTDNLDDSLSCDLYLDGGLEDSSSVSNGTTNSVSVSGLSEATHFWNATCVDEALNTGYSETWNFSVFIVPTITLLSPIDEYLTNESSIYFTFNASDYTGLQNCSILIDGSINDTKLTAELNNSGTSNFTVVGLNGYHTWQIGCYDSTVQNMYGVSETRNFTVDNSPPTPNILTQNGTWFNAQPDIDFNITDDYSSTINYTIFADGTSNLQGSVSNNTNANVQLSGLVNGSHEIILEGKDNANNSANSSSIIVWLDTVDPLVVLDSPEENANLTSNNVFFNFTVTDNLAWNLSYELYIDGGLFNSSIVLNNTLVNQSTSLVSGPHTWYVNVTDLAGNVYMSEVRNFTIVPPDLTINTGNITFNSTTAIENDNVTVFANVWNIGDTGAGNIVVQFYFGDPESGGTQIGTDHTIITLAAGGNITLNTSYIMPIGDNNFFVLVDPPIATNGSIDEEDETNNVGNNTLSVGLWHFISGSTNDGLVVQDLVNITVYDWLVSNGTGSNIFASDTEADLNFVNFTAMSRSLSGVYQSGDFYELDIAMGSENLSDSVNNTYTENNNPLGTKTYEVFNRIINDVPYVNSTNNSNFLTGILWDGADGNTEYNGTQDVVFISEINKQQQGRDSIVDYEIRVPALLRDLNVLEATAVYLYVEIK